MLISPKIITTLGHWLGYKPPVYEPVYNNTEELLKALDEEFSKQVYGQEPDISKQVNSLRQSIDTFNTEIDHITNTQEVAENVSASRNKR